MVEGRKYTKGSVQVTRMERKIDHDEGSDVSRTGQIGLERIKLQKVGTLSREVFEVRVNRTTPSWVE